jgi:hypothetical protein
LIVLAAIGNVQLTVCAGVWVPPIDLVYELGLPTVAPLVTLEIVTVQLVAPLIAFRPTAWSAASPSPQETKLEPSWQVLAGDTVTFAFTWPELPPVRENQTWLPHPLTSVVVLDALDETTIVPGPVVGGGGLLVGGGVVVPLATHPATARLPSGVMDRLLYDVQSVVVAPLFVPVT